MIEITDEEKAPADRDQEAAPAGRDQAEKSPDAEPATGRRPAIRWGIIISHRWRRGSLARTLMGFLSSTAVHLLGVIALALWIMPQVVQPSMTPLVVQAPQEPVEELETVFLDEQQQAATEISFAVARDAQPPRAETSQTDQLSKIELDESLLEDQSDTMVQIGEMLAGIIGGQGLIAEAPTGTPGKGRAVVGGYQEAIDRITREILLMLYKGKVLVVWCFDQSESMKDDRQEIRDRIERIYTELGLSDRASGDALATAVTSYGESFKVHTKQPTSDYNEIRAAIDAVPNDPSGEEMMCRAVATAIAKHRDYAVRGRRRMALILVTDESGDREGNLQFLEPTIAEAKRAQCKIYILGREAVFGHRYVYFRWQHPQTGRPHWLRVDRGPETAFVEQLQINGFRRRYDAHPSGFGPYEQSRMARETGGIFFMLPSVEPKLVRGEKRRYELEAMRWYHPDLRSRHEIFLDRDRYELRTMLWKIISDLNPYDESSGRVAEVRDRFSPDLKNFVTQVAENQKKAKVLISYMDKAAKELEKKKFLREREQELRWKANYDLMYAQLLAYQVRLYEYGAFLDRFVKKPEVVPLRKPPNLRLTYWDIRTRKETLTGELTEPYVKRANELFAEVIKEHPGTPWAARADWEIKRGYGVSLQPVYEPPYKDVENAIPLPKL